MAGRQAEAVKSRAINLALQGGGAHGAYTWGVLDRLLEEEWIEIAAVSGSSAGALNAAALKVGWVLGGRQGARAALRALWTRVSGVQDLRGVAFLRNFLPSVGVMAKAAEAMMPVSPMDVASLVVSPYDMGPFWQNPLEPVVATFDRDALAAPEGPKLIVTATNVRSGKPRVFEGAEVSREAILASAALPTMFRAVRIEGEDYWDGGYAANPALFPLYHPELPDDILLVSINPIYRDELPQSASAIVNRINEVSFNSTLLANLRAISFVKRLIAEGRMPKGAMKDVLLHVIADDGLMTSLSDRTKVTPSPLLLDTLYAAGRRSCAEFIKHRAGKIGVESSCDIEAMFS